MFWYDYWYFILVVPAMLIALWAQIRVKTTFHKYSIVQNTNGLTAADVARRILDANGLTQVRIEHVSGELSDHYDPSANVVRLSDSVYSDRSVAAIGVAAHEVGHAIQYAQGYFPIKIRSTIIPITQLGSSLAIPLCLLGIFFPAFSFLITVGIVLFSAVVLFQLVTLPVEFNASRRALQSLSADGFLNQDELAGARKTLTAAALTYVAALLVALANLLRLILRFGNRRD